MAGRPPRARGCKPPDRRHQVAHLRDAGGKQQHRQQKFETEVSGMTENVTIACPHSSKLDTCSQQISIMLKPPHVMVQGNTPQLSCSHMPSCHRVPLHYRWPVQQCGLVNLSHVHSADELLITLYLLPSTTARGSMLNAHHKRSQVRWG
jgi:hypothetical protein